MGDIGSMTGQLTKGHCLCKATRWSFEGAPTWSCYCHCDDCRRNCAAPVVAWLGVPAHKFSWTGQAPKTYESSKGVYRHFCETCGSPMGFEADHYPGGMHLYAASMERPQDFVPEFHVFAHDQLPWLPISDDLPTYTRSLLDAPDDLRDYSD